MTIKLGSWIYDTDRMTLYYAILNDCGEFEDLKPVAKFTDGGFIIVNKDYSIPVGVLNKIKNIEGDRCEGFRNVVSEHKGENDILH